MRKFREFLSKDTLFSEAPAATMYRPGLSRVAGIYKLPDLKAGTQRHVDKRTGEETPMIPVGGYQDPADYAQWQVKHQRWNENYPLERTHGVKPEQLELNMTDITYEQARSAFIDLASRIESIGSVIASGGNVPGDKDMTSRMKKALFAGQTFGQPPDQNSNIMLIYNVDGRAFFGEVSGRGGTLGFKLGEALGIIVKTETGDPDPESDTHGRISGNHYDINVEKLEYHLNIALTEFTRWERELEARVKRGQMGNWALSQLARTGGVPTTASINPTAALAAMSKR